jgi:hypothetical protein
MCLPINGPKCSTAHFRQNLYTTFFVEKKVAQNVRYFLNFQKKLLKEINRQEFAESCHPGSNLPPEKTLTHSVRKLPPADRNLLADPDPVLLAALEIRRFVDEKRL